MSGDVSMFSDDDAPLGLKPSAARNPANGHVVQNGNGRSTADSSSLSEDDDMPLVSLAALGVVRGSEVDLHALVPIPHEV